MNYLDLLRASKGTGKVPSIERTRWREKERAWAEKGLCVKCGQQPAGKTSFLCPSCEGAISREEVLAEITSARRQILSGG
jgi:hypothetical protein